MAHHGHHSLHTSLLHDTESNLGHDNDHDHDRDQGEQDLRRVETALVQLLANICRHPETGGAAELMKSDILQVLGTQGRSGWAVLGCSVYGSC